MAKTYGDDVLVLVQTLVQSAGDDLHVRILGEDALNALRSRDDVEEDDPLLRNAALLQQLWDGRETQPTRIISHTLPPVANMGSQMKTYWFSMSFGSLL